MGRQAVGPGSPPWRSLARQLLAAAVLSSCFLLTEAQDMPVTVRPPQPAEGQEVTLTPGGNPNIYSCNWFRGEDSPQNRIFVYLSSTGQENGPGYTGRETGGSDCSLHIRSLTSNDTGKYTVLKTTTAGLSEKGSVQIKVLEKLFPPTLHPAEFIAQEHMNVTLNCTTSESANVYVLWFKDGEPIPAKSILSERNRTLTIPDFSRDDEGIYICQAENPANKAQSNPSKITLDSPPSSGSGLSAGEIVGIVIGCLLGVILIIVVLYFVLQNTTLGRMEQHSSNGNIPSAPGHNQGVTDTKPTAGEEDIQYTTLAFNANSPPPKPGATIPLESGTIYSVIKNK